VDHDTTVVLLDRDRVERIVLLWAVESGLIDETDRLSVDWLSSSVAILEGSDPAFLRLSTVE
jgi:hypothetical protein